MTGAGRDAAVAPGVGEGDVIGGYRLGKKLGSGGFAVVFAASPVEGGGPEVAVKVLSPEMTADPLTRKRLAREVEAAKLLHHPGIVRALEVSVDGPGPCYAVMELVHGRSLRRILWEEGELRAVRAVTILAAVLEALSYAHSQQIVHRDIKPENILVSERGDASSVKVLDLGLARLTDEKVRTQLTDPTAVIGTYQYLAPEQALGKPAGPAADIYACGVVLFECLTGERPFHADCAVDYLVAHVRTRPPKPRRLRPELDLPVPLEAAVLRALRKRPEDRFPSAEAFRAAILDSVGLSAGPEGTAGPTTAPTASTSVGCLEEDAAARAEVAGALRADQGPLAPGQSLGQYRVVGLLGSGGMGCVYRARHRMLDREVALKVMRPDLAGSEQARARFLREAQVVARLRHPAIVELFDGDELDGHLFLAMELVDGRPLDGVLREDGALPPARVGRLFDQVLVALGLAHEAGVVHRDLKPSNLLVLAGDAVKVLDFGVAGLLDSGDGDGLTALGQVVGTPAYASPEQAQGLRADARSDLYAVGLMLYETLSGTRPFQSESASGYLVQAIAETPSPLSSRAPAVRAGSPLEAVVARALEKDPDARYQTAEAMRTALRDAVAAASPPAAPPAVSPVATLVLDLDGAPGLDRLFVTAGATLRLGRTFGARGASAPNDVVLRVVPCRSPEQDPDRWRRSMRVSKRHADIAVGAGGARITDRSSRGTTIDGTRLPRGQTSALPARFVLGIGGGALELEGRIVAGGEEAASSPPAAVVLRRRENLPGHVYALCVSSLSLGRGGESDIPLLTDGVAARHARLVRGAAGLEIEAVDGPVEVSGRPLSAGERAALAPGVTLRLGPVVARCRAAAEELFVLGETDGR